LTHRILIAGAGIGGLAAALACAQRGFEVTVIEAATAFGEVGAGIQLGPNAMKVLSALGLESRVLARASCPESIVVLEASSGKALSRMLLGQAVRQRYGQAYVCLHRADLHTILRDAVREAGIAVHCQQLLLKYEQSAQEIQGLTADLSYKTDVLIGADGLWSKVRAQMHAGHTHREALAPIATGHSAFRALVADAHMPPDLRTPHVRTWWAHDVHVVSYPLRGGELWNLVVLAETADARQEGWSLKASHAEVMRLFNRTEPLLIALLEAGGASNEGWKRWHLFDAEPLPADDMVQGRVALLGDAAHPMLPYLAQGAAIALEDAWVLAQCLSLSNDAASALKNYAQTRAERNAQVVRRARRNGQIFHLSGIMATARDAVLALQGTQVLGLPWLYGHDATR
jgi:salicylate hydroxylase